MPRLLAGLALSGAACLPVPALAQVLLVGNKGEDTVSFIALESGRECVRLPTGKAPHEIALSPDRRQAAVVAYGGTSIDIFDLRRQRLVRRIDLAPNAGPHGIVWHSPGRIAVVFDRSNTVALVDPRDGRFTAIPTGQRGSHMLVISPDRRRAYVSNILSGTVSIIDLRRGVKEADIAVGGNPEGIAITHDGRHLWVGDNSGPRVRVVDLATRTAIATLPVDPVAIRLGISPDGRTAVASSFLSGTVSLFDVASLRPLRTIAVSGAPKAMQVTLAFSQGGRRLLVAETGQDTVAELDLPSGAILRRIPVGRNGDGLAVAPGACRPRVGS
jgi:YVTN family beta-propeller protein